MVPEVIEMSSRKDLFMINAEMLGKASHFLNFNDPRSTSSWIRIENSEMMGARIIATDGRRMVIFIDPKSDFSGPGFNLEASIISDISGRNIFSPLLKQCKRTKSDVESLDSEKGYIQFDLKSKKAMINDQYFELAFNTDDYVDYKKALSKVKKVTNRKTLNALDADYFLDSKHAILNVENNLGPSQIHFVNVMMKKDQTEGQGLSLLITPYSLLLTMPLKDQSDYKISEEDLVARSFLHSKATLLEKTNLMLGFEPKNPLYAAVLQAKITKDLGDSFSGIFSNFK